MSPAQEKASEARLFRFAVHSCQLYAHTYVASGGSTAGCYQALPHDAASGQILSVGAAKYYCWCGVDSPMPRYRVMMSLQQTRIAKPWSGTHTLKGK